MNVYLGESEPKTVQLWVHHSIFGDVTSPLIAEVKAGNKWVELQSQALIDLINTKQDTLTFDDAPTSGSSNPVTSNGVYVALDELSTELAASIAEEVAAREAADATLQENIDAEADAREAADATKQDLVSGATDGNFAALDSNGQVADSGIAPADKQDTLTAGDGISIADNTVASTTWKNGDGANSVMTFGANAASGNYSVAEGYLTSASGEASHAEGYAAVASGASSHAEGERTTASGASSHAEGADTKASGNYSHAEGSDITASGIASHAEGTGTTASGDYSHAEGEGEILTFTITDVSLVGSVTTQFAVSESTSELKVGDILHYVDDNIDVWSIVANFDDTHILVTERFSSTPTESGELSIVRGLSYGNNSHTEGAKNTAYENAHAEGYQTLASGTNSHSEGRGTSSTGWAAHAEGQWSTAAGTSAHAEGENNIANPLGSHAEGVSNTIEDTVTYSSYTLGPVASHAEGMYNNIHTQGVYGGLLANGMAAHAEGFMTEANNLGEHACGICNKSNTTTFVNPLSPTDEEISSITTYSIGIGTISDYSDPTTAVRRNAVEVMRNGEIYICGVGGYDGTNPTSQTNSLQKVLENLGATIDWTVL